MSTIISPNMGLIVPTVSNEPGPTWASDINASMSIIDQHTHSPGSGVPITQDGISLSGSASTFDSLSFNGSNAFALRSSKYTAQGSPLALATDIRCTYVSGVDLYYNDGNGNQVRITSGGSVAGSTGTITGLPSGTASAAYSGGTFVFQSATATAANIDGGSFIFRNATASSKGLTLAPPNAMAANYGLVLPALPGSTSIMQLDSSGNMTAALVVDNSTLEISSNTLRIKDSGVSTAKIADGAVTNAKLAALGQQVSSSSSTFTSASTTYVDVTNLTVTIVTTGRPVRIFLNPSGSPAAIGPSSASLDAAIQSFVALLRDGSVIYEQTMYIAAHAASGAGVASVLPVSCIDFMDIPTAASHVYKIQVKTNNIVGTGSTEVTNAVLVAYEL